MSHSKTASIIICTRNRAASLRETLASMVQVQVPEYLSVELIIADNASEDDTSEIAQTCQLPQMQLRYVCAPQRGQCHARNVGIAAAKGDIILFTDDDVRPPKEWLTNMCNPIISGVADAVGGDIKFAPHLNRSWMEPLHRVWLASTESSTPHEERPLIGANMAFAREVLTKVPAFDVELGPGALGFGDDTLFSFQLQQAGYRVRVAPNAEVEHHFEAFRLSHHSFLKAAQARGRSAAYIGYHWEHKEISSLRARLTKSRLFLTLNRALRRQERRQAEGIPLWEMHAVWSVYYFQQYMIESRRPRHYEKHGLVKLKTST